jgi:hypothetical protein
MLKAWQWTDYIESGYVVLRIELAGADDQYCLHEDGVWSLRRYDPEGEDGSWEEV